VTVPREDVRLRPVDVFMVAGESSGDQLGVGLMRALAARCDRPVAFRGIGGPLMAEAGLTEIFSTGEIGTIGVASVIAKLPTLLRRLRATIEAIVAAPPDVLILIDMPDFSLRVARAVRRRLPHVPIVKYVSPSVWVWRSGRARAMREWIDLVLALLPFEPEVHRRLGGPRCIYVGHPLLARLGDLRDASAQTSAASGPPLVLVLPGSRQHEIRRLGGIFRDALEQASARYGPLEMALPTLPHLADEIAAITARWRQQPRIIIDETEKYAAFRRARAAIAASGTVTLELALAGVPHVVAYRLPVAEGLIARMMVRVPTVVLTNLVLGEMLVPQFLQTACTPANLAVALADVIDDTRARRRQLEGFRRLDDVLGTGDVMPSERAAHAVLDLLAERRVGNR
jgi:lipid-A-disaccharide synthase